ncbi:hypothetical protein ABC347_04735 [Sphingomonas sp. 1P06PA]|uniref:hypothetical protein n=1 Tax=Sphingomonas sp. 1P06PA TaxID=554121 RepID=UPI0039A64B46
MDRPHHPLTLDRHGAEHHPAVAEARIDALRAIFDTLPAARPGTRLYGDLTLRNICDAGGVIGSLAAAHLGANCCAVRAIALDKSA